MDINYKSNIEDKINKDTINYNRDELIESSKNIVEGFDCVKKAIQGLEYLARALDEIDKKEGIDNIVFEENYQKAKKIYDTKLPEKYKK